VSRKQQA